MGEVVGEEGEESTGGKEGAFNEPGALTMS